MRRAAELMSIFIFSRHHITDGMRVKATEKGKVNKDGESPGSELCRVARKFRFVFIRVKDIRRLRCPVQG